jgi:gliding motility-associated-like protein
VVEVTFTNSIGCPQTNSIPIPTVPPSVEIPNAFTPDNNDDINDHFRFIINGNVSLLEFLIFNRWGQLVYEAPQDDLEGWDGTFKGKPAASDTYVYKALLRYPNGRVETMKGDLILIR